MEFKTTTQLVNPHPTRLSDFRNTLPFNKINQSFLFYSVCCNIFSLCVCVREILQVCVFRVRMVSYIAWEWLSAEVSWYFYLV